MGRYSRNTDLHTRLLGNRDPAGRKSVKVAPAGAFQADQEPPEVALAKWKETMMEKYKFTRKEIDEWMKVTSRSQFLAYCEHENQVALEESRRPG